MNSNVIISANELELRVGDTAIVTYPDDFVVRDPILITIEYIGNYNDYFRFRGSSNVEKIIKYANHSYDWFLDVAEGKVVLYKPTEDEIVEWLLKHG